MSLNTKIFESEFGFKVPKNIIKLLSDNIFKKGMPVKLQSKQPSFFLELQYLLDIENTENFDVSGKKLKIAVTTDGFELLVDLSSNSLDILQDEFGEIDNLGVTVNDLVTSKKELV